MCVWPQHKGPSTPFGRGYRTGFNQQQILKEKVYVIFRFKNTNK